MRVPPLLLLALTTLAGAALADPAATGPAECGVDLAAGTFSWSIPGAGPLPALAVPDAAERLNRLDSLLAAGDPADALRAELGREIIGPYADRLDEVESWRFVSEQVRGMPGPLASLGTLVLPDGTGDPALARHVVSLGWPRPLRTPEARVDRGGGTLLLSAPFATGVAPVTDDPDTLRRALRGAARSVRLVPRNETDAQTLRRALEEIRPSVWWLRATPDQLAGLQPALGALPPVVVWTLPSRYAGPGPALTPVTLASAGTGPACLVVATRAVPETALAPLARQLADGLARGLSCGRALHEAQRRQLEAGVPLPVVSSLVLLGDAGAKSSLARASWLRRWWN